MFYLQGLALAHQLQELELTNAKMSLKLLRGLVQLKLLASFHTLRFIKVQEMQPEDEILVREIVGVRVHVMFDQ